jgi:hypothetical protein
MFSTVFGLPAHPLIVHAVVVLVPLAALSGLVVAVWPTARARYAPIALAIATPALLAVPLATHTGEQLQDHVRDSALVDRHAHMAEGLLPFMAVLWVALAVLVGVQWYGRRRAAEAAGRAVRPAAPSYAGRPEASPYAGRPEASPYGGPTGQPAWMSYVGVGAAVVTVLAGVASGVQVVRIGHSGSEAAWHGVATGSAHSSGPHH